MQIQQALQWAAGQFTHSDTAALDARVLLCAVLEQTQTYLYTWPDKLLTETHLQRFTQMVEQRAQGRPVAYITGTRDFWTFTLNVSDATLIPRPDTEILVEEALSRLPEGPSAICDLGTGTGAIALALASERPQALVTGVDFQPEAVVLATANAAALNITNVRFIQSSWFDSLTGQQFNLIASNPPYVEQNSEYLKQGDVRFEPDSALTSGADGLDDIRLIISAAPAHLLPGGWLLLEHGYQQGPAIRELLQQRGFNQISTARDLAGQPRVTIGQLNNPA